MNVTVLAATYQEGRRYLSSLGIRGNVVFDARSATGRRFEVVLELPSFASNRARFAVESMMRYGHRDMIRMLIVDEDEVIEPEDHPLKHGGFDPEVVDEPAPAEKPKPKARKKPAPKPKPAPEPADEVDLFEGAH